MALDPTPPSPNTRVRDLSSVYALRSILEPIDLARLFPDTRPLEVELGSGDGSFLIERAARHPDLNFIGVERLLGRVTKMARKASRAGLRNLRGIRIESSYFLEYLLPQGTADAIHLYFPDPWPKRKHHRHRLVNDRFPNLAARALSSSGTVYLRTDHEDYFRQMTQVFEAAIQFRKVETPEALMVVVTDFEREFQARGIQTLRAAYQKV